MRNSNHVYFLKFKLTDSFSFFTFIHRFGSRIVGPNGVSANALPQSPFLYGHSPWDLFTIDIRRPQLGRVHLTAVWTRQGMGRGQCLITCLYQVMHLLFTCIIRYHQTGILRGRLHQNLLLTVLKWVPWQRQLREWKDRQLLILTSPFHSMALPSNFLLVRMFHSNAQVTPLVTVAMARRALWRHNLIARNVSPRYRVLSVTARVLPRWGWRPKNMQLEWIWEEHWMEEQKYESIRWFFRNRNCSLLIFIPFDSKKLF